METIYCVHGKFVSHTSQAVSRATHLIPARVTMRKQFDRKSNGSKNEKEKGRLCHVFLRQIDWQKKWHIVTVTDSREYCMHGKLIYTLVEQSRWPDSSRDSQVIATEHFSPCLTNRAIINNSIFTLTNSKHNNNIIMVFKYCLLVINVKSSRQSEKNAIDAISAIRVYKIIILEPDHLSSYLTL